MRPTLARGLSRTRRGYAAIVLVVCMFVLLAFVAMGVDWGAVTSAKAELQVAADAAALAAAAELPNQAGAVSLGQDYAAQVSVRGVPITDTLVEIGDWDRGTRTFTPNSSPDATTVRVRTRRVLELPIMRIFGIPSVTLHAVAGAGVTYRQLPDLVIVQDITGSFSAEIGQARAADLALIDCVDQFASGNTQVGFVTFTGFEQNMLNPDAMVTYGAGFPRVAAQINATKVCGNTGMPACSGTNIASGLYLAKSVLDGSTSDGRVGRAAVLVSDGAPNANSKVCTKTGGSGGRRGGSSSGGSYQSPASAALCPGWSNSPSNTKLENSALALRDQFEADGYDLYTVFYNETSDAAQTAFMQNMTAGKGTYLESPDPNDLGALLQDVCHTYVAENMGLVF